MTQPVIFDRLNGREVISLPPEPLLGRYVVEGNDVQVNGSPAADGDFVVPDTQLRISVRSPSGDVIKAILPRAERPEEDETGDALREIAELLGSVSGAADLADCSPLASPDPARSSETDLDVAIREGEPHLLAVARRPHSRLEASVERVPVARARRVPPRAIDYLAAHSEDWQRRSPSRVVPRKIFARRLDDRLDIYENRVAARTTDRTLDALRRRITGLTTIAEIYDDVRRFHRLLGGHHRLVRRLSMLWSAQVAEAAGDPRARSLADSLASSHRRISGVLSSPMYRAISPLAAVERSLRATNVLAAHQDYRRVAELWRTLHASDEVPDALAEEELEQRRCSDFDAFCQLLVLRALDAEDGMQWDPEDWSTGSMEGAKRLDGWFGPLTLSADRRSGITLASAERVLVRFVPLVAAVAGLSPDGVPEPDRVTRRLLAAAEVAQTDELTVVLYLGIRKERQRLPDAVACAANPVPDFAQATGALVVPVSPFDLLSLERVARVLRWVIVGGLMLAYPPQVECRGNLRDELTAAIDWLEPTAGDRHHLSVLAAPEGDRRRDLDRWLETRRRGLRPRHDDAQQRALDALVQALDANQLAVEFAALQRCPICAGSGQLRPWSRASFFVRCTRCEAEWGLRVCECGSRTPFLRHAEPSGATQVANVSDELDLAVGRDVLAAPCLLDASKYPCRACGRCEGGDKRDGPCARCEGLALLRRDTHSVVPLRSPAEPARLRRSAT